MTEKKQITIFVDEKDLQKIDEASKKEKRSRSNFMILSSLQEAEKLLDEENSNNYD